MPELKRVIAAYGDQVVMKETLGAALLETRVLYQSSKATALMGPAVPPMIFSGKPIK
jgi:uncharacterized membrane protein (UPF0182 family)